MTMMPKNSMRTMKVKRMEVIWQFCAERNRKFGLSQAIVDLNVKKGDSIDWNILISTGLADVYNDDLDNDDNDDDFDADEHEGDSEGDSDLAEEEEGDDEGTSSTGFLCGNLTECVLIFVSIRFFFCVYRRITSSGHQKKA